MDIRDRVCILMTRVLGLDGSAINDELSVGDVGNWDSLGHVALISALEEEFGFILDIDETLDMESVADIVEIIEERLGEK